MKKLMIAALAVAMAAATQAASINWKYTTTDADFASAHVYTIIGSTVPTEIENWSTWLKSATQAPGGDGVLTYNMMKKNYSKSVEASGDAITKDKSYYFIVVDEDIENFAVSSVYAGNSIVYAATESAIVTTPVFGEWTKIGKEEPTPEPTSGLLMLLGMAGLALRRKQK